MNVMLKPELEKYIARKMESGQYADASAVVNEALEVLKEQEEFSPAQEVYFRREVARGLEQLDKGQYGNSDVAKIIAEERQRLAGQKGHG